jgi:hypothetical protein
MFGTIRIPWALKFWGKLILLNFVPLPYSFWRKIGVFKHGTMDSLSDVQRVHREVLGEIGSFRNKTILEIGPGDSIVSGMVFYCEQAQRTHLVDVDRFAIDDLEYYQDVIEELKAIYPNTTFNIDFADFSELLDNFQISYQTNGLDALSNINSRSIDILFSNAVLEHLEIYELDYLFSETRRVLNFNGIAIHKIDFRDHISGKFDHLRFSSRFWNSRFVKKSNQFVNRLHLHEYLAMAQSKELDFKVLSISNPQTINPLKYHTSISKYWSQGDLVLGALVAFYAPNKTELE